MCSLGGIADVDLALRSRNIKDDVMVVGVWECVLLCDGVCGDGVLRACVCRLM